MGDSHTLNVIISSRPFCKHLKAANKDCEKTRNCLDVDNYKPNEDQMPFRFTKGCKW